MASKVHRVRFYNPKPLAINSFAFNRKENCLAISREDASIEIWDMNHSPYLLKSIPGFDNGSVEALCWVEQRLVSTGMGGALVEWDLDLLTSKWSALLTGYAAWCLDVDAAQTMVAVGTEQGYLNLFRVEPDQFVYDKLFDRQEGRIICCKFNKTGQVLVTGSVAAIRIWDVVSGLALHRLQAGRRGRECLVWSLVVLSDMTIIAGDSDGRLTFWDGNLAEQIESFATHKADILSVVVSEDEKFMYCSGVDPAIVCYMQVHVQNKGDTHKKLRWVRSVQREVHEHDVRGLVLKGKMLISLSADGYIALSSYPPKWLLRVPPMPPGPRVATAATPSNHNLLLLKYSHHIEVWKLGKYSTNEKGNPVFVNKDKCKSAHEPTHKAPTLEEDSRCDGVILQNVGKSRNALKLEDRPVKLVSLRAKRGRPIKCCAISPSGQFIMYSTDEAVRVFSLELEELGEEWNLMKCPVLAPGLAAGCSRAVFTRDSSLLALHTHSGAVLVLQVEPRAGLALHQHILTAPHVKEATLLHMETATVESTRTTYLACADTRGAVAVWRRPGGGGEFAHHATLPTYTCVPAALAIDNVNELLLVVYVDNSIVEYDLKQRRLTAEWQRRLPGEWRARRVALTGASYRPRDPARLVLYDHTSVGILDKDDRRRTDKTEEYEPCTKKRQAKKYFQLKYKTIPCKYLAGLAWLSADEAVLVEVLPENIISQLPPVLATDKFPRV